MPDITIVAGTGATAAQANAYMVHTGSTWNTWTPVVTQSAAVTVTVNEATYFRAGRLIQFTLSLTVGSTGTGANDVVVSLPVASKAGYVALASCLGFGRIFDQSAGLNYAGIAVWATSTTMKLVSASGTGTLGAAVFTAALATSDLITVNGTYEAAAG